MKEWVISVVSVIVLTVILDLFLSEGETKKYIKGIMSLIVIAVIISPVPKLLKKDFNLSDYFTAESEAEGKIVTNEDLLYTINMSKYAEKKTLIIKYFENEGINGALVNININYGSSSDEEISMVTIDLQNAVISGAAENININDKIYGIVIAVLSVSKERIYIYGNDKS